MKIHLLTIPVTTILLIILLVAVTAVAATRQNRSATHAAKETTADTILTESSEQPVILTLTDEDFQQVADMLGVEVASIKAVVEIEAGRTHQGFHAPGVPIVNFDYSMFSRFASKKGINLSKYRRTHPLVFSGNRRGGQAAEYNRLQAAKGINYNAAIEGTFWGMFQIGGFNWHKCGTASINEFERLMCRSERDQLDLFAAFIKNTGLLKHLQSKNWSAFARGYNGPSYASRGYHIRLANAYRRYAGR